MAELDERVEQLEIDLAELKVGIKGLLVELKVLMAREQNPLADPSEEHSKPTRDSPVIIAVPSAGD